MQDYSAYIQYNEDNSVKVPFGRVVEWYISNHSLLKNRRLKSQSRLYTSELVKEGYITIQRVKGAIDFIEWSTRNGKIKSTNRIDDVITLIQKGHELLEQINSKEKRDKLCWSWTINSEFPNGLKNYQDMHLCNEPNIITNNTIPKIKRLNLLRGVYDNVLLSRRADHRSNKGIKSKLLASMNGANEEILSQELNNQKFICTDNKLKQFIAHDDKKLKNNSEFGQLYIGIDGKYDLNIDHTLVLSIIAKNKAGFAMPIAFDLPNNSGFQRVTVCSSAYLWNPVAMIDKHRPIKLGVDKLLCRTILYIQLHWDLAVQINFLFNIFIDNLNLSNSNKKKIKKDIQNNWICDEWCMQFIDARRLPVNNEFFWTTNNFTEKINRTIKVTYSGKQTVLTFVERLYGMTLIHKNLVENHTGKLIYEAGLVTTFNTQSVEQRELPPKISQDILKRLNLKTSIMQNLNSLFKQMYKNHNIQEKDGYYITNIITGECLNYFDFIWNGSFQDICKHCHSARIFIKSFKNPNVINKLKERLVTFFKNKQRTLPPELKNYNIYQGDIETAFQEIVKEYNEKECKIQSDPFRPLELDQKDKKSLIGAPAKATVKP
ncbi:hypothetical protein GLOIN_2v1872702 [Rhizophagus clarus]|uniref:Uncharacterized protein n=1 Tax=Rhizophagus clarus TaxID=94130 RepID=A0A8H3MEZ8_9GLOM|nr:hypothetical protein GLOIN_2v1872702 [Rhizophagus clarus]